MAHVNEAIESELCVVDCSQNDANREQVEMSTLTAIMCVARLSEKGKKLVEDASDEVINDMLNEYARVRILY